MSREVLIVISDKQFQELTAKLDVIHQLLIVMKQPTMGGCLTQEQVQAATGLSRGTLLKMRKNGLIRAMKLGGKKLYYNLEDFQSLVGSAD